MSIERAADKAGAVYVNKFYVQTVDGGQCVKLVFFEEGIGGDLHARSSVLISRSNCEALLALSGQVLNADKQDVN